MISSKSGHCPSFVSQAAHTLSWSSPTSGNSRRRQWAGSTSSRLPTSTACPMPSRRAFIRHYIYSHTHTHLQMRAFGSCCAPVYPLLLSLAPLLPPIVPNLPAHCFHPLLQAPMLYHIILYHGYKVKVARLTNNKVYGLYEGLKSLSRALPKNGSSGNSSGDLPRNLPGPAIFAQLRLFWHPS